jgi:hypothetical protein
VAFSILEANMERWQEWEWWVEREKASVKENFYNAGCERWTEANDPPTCPHEVIWVVWMSDQEDVIYVCRKHALEFAQMPTFLKMEPYRKVVV